MTTIYKYVKYRNCVKKSLLGKVQHLKSCNFWSVMISFISKNKNKISEGVFCIICTYELKKCRKLIKKSHLENGKKAFDFVTFFTCTRVQRSLWFCNSFHVYTSSIPSIHCITKCGPSIHYITKWGQTEYQVFLMKKTETEFLRPE